MTCDDCRALFVAARRGTLDADGRRALDEHVTECAACRKARAADEVLDAVLRERPRHRAPASLIARITPAAPVTAPAPRRAPSWVKRGALAFAVTASLALILVVRDRAAASRLSTEAVNDHLRSLYAERPLEIESGGIHQVKPWFSGKVDFAPSIAFEGDDEFPLLGGAVAYFVDRKAAELRYQRRAHVITLLVFPANGLDWPVDVGRRAEDVRGFHVLMWRRGELGYALVSDVSPRELVTLADKVAP